MAMHFDDRIRGCTACGRQFTRKTNSRAEVTCGNCKKTQAFQGTAPAEDAEAQSDQHTEAIGMNTDWIVEWRHTPQWVDHPVHIENWDRILVAVGRGSDSATVTADTTPMTLPEAQERAGWGWDHYGRVVEVLSELERGADAPDSPPVVAESAEVVPPADSPQPEWEDPFRPWADTLAHAQAVAEFLSKSQESPVWDKVVHQGGWLVSDSKRTAEEMANEWHWQDPMPELAMYQQEFEFFASEYRGDVEDKRFMDWFPPLEEVRRRMTLPPSVPEQYPTDADLPPRWATPESFKSKGMTWRQTEYEFWENCQGHWGWRPQLDWLVGEPMPTQQEVIDRIADLPVFTEADIPKDRSPEETKELMEWVGWSKPQVGSVFATGDEKIVHLRDERDSSVQEEFVPFQQGGRTVRRDGYDRWVISGTGRFTEWFLERFQPYHGWYVTFNGLVNPITGAGFGDHPDEDPYRHESPTKMGDFSFGDGLLYGTDQGMTPLHACGPATAIDCAIRYIERVEWAYGALETKPAWMTWVLEAQPASAA